jgi:hypothetical protein
MSNYTPIIDYQGNLTFKTISELIADLKVKKDEFDIDVVIYKKIISLMIEILENIYRYSDHFKHFIKDNPLYEPAFQLARNESDYCVHSSNPIRKDDIDRVKKKIDKINTLKSEEMRLFYRETITNGEFTEKGGAGLGFIEMAKISCHPLQYQFKSLDEEFYNFELDLLVD